MTQAANGALLKMSGLVEASGVPAPTIKHYLREGLLPEPVKTSRNMAWYRPETVERIRLIKRLQEERYLPLKAIRALFEEDPAQAEAIATVITKGSWLTSSWREAARAIGNMIATAALWCRVSAIARQSR